MNPTFYYEYGKSRLEENHSFGDVYGGSANG
jgi:hypothetical protein